MTALHYVAQDGPGMTGSSVLLRSMPQVDYLDECQQVGVVGVLGRSRSSALAFVAV
jgi:hypothetical protein